MLLCPSCLGSRTEKCRKIGHLATGTKKTIIFKQILIMLSVSQEKTYFQILRELGM